MEEINNVQRLGESLNSVYWIVYQTINTENNYSYIGVHKTSNPYIFDGYIGCGVNINKAYTYANPKTAFLHAVKEFGVKAFKRIILNIFDNETDAYALEAKIVNDNYLARPDVYNMILGGIFYDKKPIYQYSRDGLFLNEYKTFRETPFGATARYAAITGCLCNSEYYFCYVKADSYSKARDIYTKDLILYQYDSDGKYIAEFKYKDALKTAANVITSLQHKRLDSSNHYWSYEKLDYYSNKPLGKQYRRIGKYKDGVLIKEYPNSAQCYKENGKGVYKALNGIRNQYKGYTYRYIE